MLDAAPEHDDFVLGGEDLRVVGALGLASQPNTLSTARGGNRSSARAETAGYESSRDWMPKLIFPGFLQEYGQISDCDKAQHSQEALRSARAELLNPGGIGAHRLVIEPSIVRVERARRSGLAAMQSGAENS